MIIVVIGIKDETIWKQLKCQYIGHQLIEINDPGFLDISDIKEYQNEMFRQQIINISKQKNKSLLFVTYNTIINTDQINKDTIHVCLKLRDLFNTFKISYDVVQSWEMMSDNYIQCGDDLINMFDMLNIDIFGKIINILFKNIKLMKDFTLPTKKDDILYFIPSIIEPHSPSIYTKEDRLKQTIKQLNSIHKYNHNNKTILLELSDIESLTFSDLFRLNDAVSLVVLFGYDESKRQLARQRNKNHGEIELLKFVLKQIECQEFSHFYKFGGRYKLNNDYDGLFDNDYDVCCKLIKGDHNAYRQDIVEPVIYSVKSNKVKCYIESLDVMSNILKNNYLDVERMLIDFVYSNNYKTKTVEQLRVSGYSAIGGIYRNL